MNLTDTVAAAGVLRGVDKKKIIVPVIGIGIVAIIFLMSLFRQPSAEDGAAAAIEGLAKKGVFSQQAQVSTPETAPPTPSPNYDYITCTHWKAGDPPCEPLNPQPLTTEARFLIGFQGGVINGTLNSDNTRTIAEQMRRMMGTDQCTMYLGITKDTNGLSKFTVFPSQAAATPGATKLYDCTPKGGETTITAPTAGGA